MTALRPAHVDGEARRIHQEDLCQALGVPPSRKYQNEGGPGPKEIVGLFRRTMAPRVAADAIWRFVDALAWNWLIAGTDAHAKNYSLLIAANDIRLAAAVRRRVRAPLRNPRAKAALRDEDRRRLPGVPVAQHVARAARELDLDLDETFQRVDALAAQAPDAFADAASTDDVTGLARESAGSAGRPRRGSGRSLSRATSIGSERPELDGRQDAECRLSGQIRVIGA